MNQRIDAKAAHELANYLAVILSYARIIKRELDDHDAVSQDISEIVLAAEAALQIVKSDAVKEPR